MSDKKPTRKDKTENEEEIEMEFEEDLEDKKNEKKVEHKPSVSSGDVSTKDGLKELIEKNIKWSQVIYEQNKKINRRLTWMVVTGYIKLAIILAPLIIALIYLPPLIKDFIDQYGSVIGVQGGGFEQIMQLYKEAFGENTNLTPEQIQKYLQTLQK